jgi:hypothetical protein
MVNLDLTISGDAQILKQRQHLCGIDLRSSGCKIQARLTATFFGSASGYGSISFSRRLWIVVYLPASKANWFQVGNPHSRLTADYCARNPLLFVLRIEALDKSREVLGKWSTGTFAVAENPVYQDLDPIPQLLRCV